MYHDYSTKLIRDYVLLNAISPKEELLKYYVLEKPELFREFFILGLIAQIDKRLEHKVCCECWLECNPDEKIVQEFIDRFRGNVPTIEQAKKTNMPLREYIKKLHTTLSTNYISAIEKAINLIEISN